MWETRVQSLGREDALEKERATHSSALAWRIPWTEEPSRLQSTGSQSRTRLSDFTHPLYSLARLSSLCLRICRTMLLASQSYPESSVRQHCVCVYIAFLLVLRLTGKEIACNAGDAMENPMDRGAWQAIVLSQSQTRLKGLSTRTHVLYIYL